MKHDYEAALKELNTIDEGASFLLRMLNEPDEMVVYNLPSFRADMHSMVKLIREYGATWNWALKLVAKLEQEPSEGMFLAGDTAFENGYIREMFEAMLDQARKEIG